MIFLNYNNLDSETQQRLSEQARQEIEERHKESLITYANENGLDYETVLEEETIRKLYSYKFSFGI